MKLKAITLNFKKHSWNIKITSLKNLCMTITKFFYYAVLPYLGALGHLLM